MKYDGLNATQWMRPEGEHPVSAKCWGLRNRFVRWWVLGCTPDNPISTLPFEKSRIFLGANRGSAGVQPGFSRGSAHFRFFFLWRFFCDPKISAFPKVKLLVKILILGVQLGFSWQKRGAHPLVYPRYNKRHNGSHKHCAVIIDNGWTSPFVLFELGIIMQYDVMKKIQSYVIYQSYW